MPAGQTDSLSSVTGEGTSEGTGPSSLTLLLRELEAIAAGASSSSLDATISVDLMVFFLKPEAGGAGAGSLKQFCCRGQSLHLDRFPGRFGYRWLGSRCLFQFFRCRLR